MGLLSGGINEVIATTKGNAAPMGIHYREGKTTVIVFSASHTAQNIKRDGWMVANFIHDPVLYVRTAFEDIPADNFVDEPVAGKMMQRLPDAEGWIAFTATIERETAETIIVQLKPEKELIEGVSFHPVNRGFNSVIDATVHATRYKSSRDPELKKLIDYHFGLIRRCGGKRELAALELLTKYIAE